jgi:hypothetical protein
MEEPLKEENAMENLIGQSHVVEKKETVDVLSGGGRVEKIEDAKLGCEKLTIALHYVHISKLRDADMVKVSPTMEFLKSIISTTQLNPHTHLLKPGKNYD